MAEKTFTMTEMQKILQANGLDIKELAKTASDLKNGKFNNTTNKTHAGVTWKCALVNYPDCVIERKTSTTTKQLVLMPSVNAYYIKDITHGTVDGLTQQGYTSFTASMSDIDMPEGFWVKTLKSGKVFYNQLSICLKNDIYRTMIKAKCAPPVDELELNWNKTELRSDWGYLSAYQAYPHIFKECWNDEDLRPTVCESKSAFIQNLIEKFGLNNTRDFLQSWKISLFKKQPTMYNARYAPFPTVFPAINMEYRAFKEYVLYKSVRMGYGCDPMKFWQIWQDTINMQELLYNKIKEKYPDNLPIYHNQLSYKCILNRQKIDQELFNKQSEQTQKYEMNIGDYTFIAPRVKEDFYDEATQQANCLASYVNMYTQGDCHILFMRKQNSLSTSVVTIELRGDHVRQAYQAHNVHVTHDQQVVIDRWLEKVKKINAGEIAGDKLIELGKNAKELIQKQLLSDK